MSQVKEKQINFAFNRFSLSACDYLVFSGDLEDENCHLAHGEGFTFQVFIGPRYTWGPIYGSRCL